MSIDGYTVWRERECICWRGSIPLDEALALMRVWKRHTRTLYVDFFLGERLGHTVQGSRAALNAWRVELGIEPLVDAKPKAKRAKARRL